MTHRWLLAGMMFVLFAGSLCGAMRPNVILINCDDLGYGDLGCYGAKDVRTPNLDRMAKEGTRFTDFSVTTALCTPSRAALMTGKYPFRVGLAAGVLRPDAKNGLAHEEWTLGDVFQSAGYATGYIGKWHLGFQPGMRPMDQGFGSYFGVLHNLDRFETAHFESEGGMPVLRGDEVIHRPAVPAEMTGLYTRECLHWIERNRSSSFFLYVGHAMPHLPFDASASFKGKSRRGLYGDCIEELDWSVGEILAALRKLSLADKTLVIFTSDNGPERNTPGTAKPLSGTKHTVFEGGLRVPCLAWWPGTVPSDRVCDAFVSTLDVLPTLASLCGAQLPELRLDGFDMTPTLLGTSDAPAARQSLYSLYRSARPEVPRKESIRGRRWKLHLDTPRKLYDLQNDLAETTDVAKQHPEIVQRLERLAEEIRKDR